jgi:hypothetical protein
MILMPLTRNDLAVGGGICFASERLMVREPNSESPVMVTGMSDVTMRSLAPKRENSTTSVTPSGNWA